MEPKKLVVEVTQEDINLGCKGDSGNCAIARAIVRQGYAAAVYTDIIIWDDTTKAFYGGKTPQDAMAFIHRFDSVDPKVSATAKPFTFEVELPEISPVEVKRLFYKFSEKKHAYNNKCNFRAA